ncbi:unnamed protein product, partial [marine sediment metagenome]
KRVDYTSIGDAVNLGARLEGTNKVYGTLIIMSEFTYAKVKDWVICRELDSIRVKGKNEPVIIYEVIDFTPEGKDLTEDMVIKPKEDPFAKPKSKPDEKEKPAEVSEETEKPGEEEPSATESEETENIVEEKAEEKTEEKAEDKPTEESQPVVSKDETGEKNGARGKSEDGSVEIDTGPKVTV